MTLTTLLLILLFLMVLSCLGLFWAKHTSTGDNESTAPPCSVSIIVPLTGYSDNLLSELQSICAQARDFQRIICVTEHNNDPAVPAVTRLKSLDTRAVHVLAGRTSRCSQKNFNLLAGYNYARDKSDILVFCDAGHVAPPHWLGNLLSPLLHDPGVTVSSGYHHVLPGQSSLAIYCRAVCVAVLHFFRRIPGLSQPWGGATAIRVSDFQSMRVDEHWSTAIVDDVVLARLLKKSGKMLATPVGADTRTYIHTPSLSSMLKWLTRQIAYLKYIFPGTWLFLGIALFCHWLGTCSTLIILGLAPFLILPQSAITCSFVYIFIYFLFCFSLRLYHPAPGSVPRWYGACFLCCFLPFWCYVDTALTSKISWGDTVYSVGKHGKVIHLEKSGSTG